MDSETFFKEFIVGFGFLSGIWMAVGRDPEAEIFQAFAKVIEMLNPGSGFSFLFTILPIIVLILTTIFIFALAGWIGIVAVACGFLAGLLVLFSPFISLIFIIIAFILGAIATRG